MLKGPFEEGVTLVLVVVTATPLIVSFPKAFKAIIGVTPETNVTYGSLTASIVQAVVTLLLIAFA